VDGEEAAQAGVEFRLLGPLEALRNGIGLDLGPPKQRALLAALLLAGGRVVSNDRLIEAVWGIDPPPQAVSSLQAYVSRLRSLFPTASGADVQLVRQAPGYRVRAENVDLVEFRRLSEQAGSALATRQWALSAAAAGRALELWRGPLLADLHDQPWVMGEAARLDEARALCSEVLITALLGQGRVADALDRSHRLVEEYPLREHVRWLAMIALYRAGRSPEALDTFQDHSHQLGEQLGLLPSPELRDLEGAILRHDPALRAWPADPAEDIETPASDTNAKDTNAKDTDAKDTDNGGVADVRTEDGSGVISRRAVVIVGRDQELEVIDQLLVEVAEGQERWLLLTGPAGIGKTRLAEETARRARLRGARIVWSSCPDDEGTPTWWPLRPLVRDLGGDVDAVFLPPAGTDADTVRFQVYEKLSAQLIDAAAQRPLVVVIDDVQWLDAASARCLAFVARALRGHRIGVVLTLRDSEPRLGLEPLLSTLVRQANAVHVVVPPLDAVAASALVDQVSGESLAVPETSELLVRTGSNPLLLIEYARLPPGERSSGGLPLAARSLLGRRLNRLSEDVLSALRAAAVIGDVFELDLLADVLGLSRLQVVDLFDVAAGEEIIMPAHDRHGYQFTHALLRDEVLLRLSVLRRQALHGRIAETLADRGRDTRTLLRRAQHLTEALPLADPHTVVAACTAAAHDAEQRWDWDIAAQQWAGALSALQMLPGSEQSDRDELLIARLTSLARAGLGQTVLDATDAALDDAVREGRTVTIGRLAAALLRTSGAWPWAAYGADPSALLARLEGLTSLVVADPAAHARVLAALAVGNCYATDPAIPDAQSREAIEIAERLGDREVLADVLIGRVLSFVGIASHAEETIRLLDRLHELPHSQAPVDEVMRHNVLTMALFNRGDVEGAVLNLRQGISGSDQLRLTVTRAQLRWAEATLAHWHGDLDRADELVAKAYTLHRQTELYSADSTFLSAHLSLLWDRGQVASDPAAIRRSSEPLVWGALAAAESGQIRAGRALIARRLLVTAAEYWHTLGYLTLLGHAAADLADTESGQVLLERLSPHSRYLAQIGQTASIGPVALATARLRMLLDDADGARADLTQAEQLARAGRGRNAALRVRLIAALLDPPGPQRAATLRDVANEAESVGMAGVAAAARRAE
jgi:DNA-binding SARP family transcriptional activator/nucleoside-triphosphatase THEP1